MKRSMGQLSYKVDGPPPQNKRPELPFESTQSRSRSMGFIVATFVVFQLVVFSGVESSSRGVFEHEVRETLLNEYDKIVRPVGKRSDVLKVKFAMQIGRIAKVDSKEQQLTLEAWVLQEWSNILLTWDPANETFGNITRVRFASDEIWVPDTALYNNGDKNTPLAGGPTKFLTSVLVKNDGTCVWQGPATFIATCSMDIKHWPFDQQTCNLSFGSWTYGENQFVLRDFKPKKQVTERFVSSGDWKIDKIVTTVDTTDHGDCCPFEFSQITYTISMNRIPLYHWFYLITPGLILVFLALLSFFIPTNSGERIGFVTTLLLGMMVFLLLIPSSLPETSESIPLLGQFMMATLVIITLVLVATTANLIMYFSEGKAPPALQKFVNLCRTERAKKCRRIQVSSSNGVETDDGQPQNASVTAIQLSEQRINSAKSNRESIESSDWKQLNTSEEQTWQEVSEKMDFIFFIVFFFISLITFACIFGVALIY